MNRVARFQSTRLSRHEHHDFTRLSRRHALPYHLRITPADYREIIQREKRRALIFAFILLAFLAHIAIFLLRD